METCISLPESLCYTSDKDPGLHRKKCGRGFVYLTPTGKKLSDGPSIKRVKDLVIPPIWQNVWICRKANGHLQVTGLDSKNRKQYIYHPMWVEHSQKNKFDSMIAFGNLLPGIREKVKADLRKRGWPKEKVIALTIDMMDHYFIRVGNKFYQEQNKTFGLTTLRRKHMSQNENGVTLSFKAKSGKWREIPIDSKRMCRLIKGTSELPGYEIFRYLDDNQESHAVCSEDVNEYLGLITGEQFTAKDFRTWGGTRLAIENFEKAKEAVAEKPNTKLETAVVRLVAETLGNTVDTCRKYYIHPTVLSALIEDKVPKLRGKSKKNLYPSERLALAILGNE